MPAEVKITLCTSAVGERIIMARPLPAVSSYRLVWSKRELGGRAWLARDQKRVLNLVSPPIGHLYEGAPRFFETLQCVWYRLGTGY